MPQLRGLARDLLLQKVGQVHGMAAEDLRNTRRDMAGDIEVDAVGGGEEGQVYLVILRDGDQVTHTVAGLAEAGSASHPLDDPVPLVHLLHHLLLVLALGVPKLLLIL